MAKTDETRKRRSKNKGLKQTDVKKREVEKKNVKKNDSLMIPLTFSKCGLSNAGASAHHFSRALTATTAVGRCEAPDVRATLTAGTRGLISPPNNPNGALRRVSVQAARSSSRKPSRRTVTHSRYLFWRGARWKRRVR